MKHVPEEYKEGEQPENFIQTIQGEDATLRSEPSLYAKYDRSSQRLCQIV